MNSPGIPDWNFEFDPPLTNPKKNIGQDHDLAELLWQNGQVVLQSQNNRKPSSPSRSDAAARQPCRSQDPSARPEGSLGVNLIQDDEMVSWIHYPVEDSFQKEFCSHFFGELPTLNPMDVDGTLKQADHEKPVSFNSFVGGSQLLHSRTVAAPEVPVGQLPPPRFQVPDPARPACNNVSQGVPGKIVNFSQLALPFKSEARPLNFQIGQQGSGVITRADAREGSVMTVGSSRCGSNQILNDRPDLSRASSNGVGTAGCISTGIVKEDDCYMLSMSQTEGRKTETLEPTVTSSSGGSGSSFGATTKQGPDSSMSHKRKGREGEESECQSEAVEIEMANGKKPMQRSGGSTRRSRAAEVHNLSERRRRDRINKKMKALQELIPHCNKTDKASMLDEAIEYLKSLQLQLQVMWMGGGMTPMMIPGAQHYMSPMGLTMCPPGLPAVHPNMRLPRMPVVDQSFPMIPTNNQAMFGQAPVLNPLNFQNQMANPSFPEQFARYMSMHNMQAPPQGGAQQQQMHPLPSGSTSSMPAYTGGAAANGSSGSKIG
ncbi:hypothetical protein MLD38_030306 [Melastoma candidum]|uniref:Uncharacterized protein n=1 Tax=Melastoma candidum TaxID=119954 RepID=A0ACB9MLU6_9MYRT|nr:hypothetical protein MLD38_030306 [Melastoma candidum]